MTHRGRTARHHRGPLHRRRAAAAPRAGRHRDRAPPRSAPRPQVSLTTNGIGLSRMAGPLAEAGLHRVNVSLDTLDRETFKTLAHRDRLADVLDGLAAADAAGLRPVKVNTVLMRGVNDHEAVPLLRYCLERGYELRFIEQMPLDAQHGWRRENMVTADEILARLTDDFDLSPTTRTSAGSAPAELFLVGRRAGQGRRDRLGHPAVLRRLRPGTAHRGRPDPQLPVRHRGVRPACRAAFGRRRRRARRALAGRGRGSRRPGTASTTRASCSRPVRCRPSAAERSPRCPRAGGRPRGRVRMSARYDARVSAGGHVSGFG